jgi:tetratricopeptide (TPR) repeat protein
MAPGFGFAWVRLAEMEFGFGRTSAALVALERGLSLMPRNAQGLALKGFLFSAQNRVAQARKSFDAAIAIDGALSDAWLGRGLTYIREGADLAGRRDLLVAAMMDPNRSLPHSYLAKAFSQSGDEAVAARELARAIALDRDDPTPALYSAIRHKQANNYNAAVRDLERSVALNDNRRIYRSRFLLDQDRAIRGANLAAIYADAGMIEQGFREAVRALDSDYGSAPAHLFLANSYDAQRDPSRILLRHETAWFSELLLSNLLSPVGGGPLSQFVSGQEYAKLFEREGLGANSVTEYASDGELRETASHFGTFGNFSYAVDMQFQYNDGRRPNNRISRLETYVQLKQQLGPDDTAFFQTKFENLRHGDIFQRYDPSSIDTDRSALTFDFREKQDPALLLLGWHHQWSPQDHTLLLLGRLANRQVLTSAGTTQELLTRDVSAFTSGLPAGLNDFNQPFQNPQIIQTLSGLVGRGTIHSSSRSSLG